MGLSVWPPPAATPTIALLAEEKTFFEPKGQLHLGLPGLRVVGNDSGVVSKGSGQLVPVTRLLLQQHTMTPSGILPTGSSLPMLSWFSLHSTQLASVDALGSDEQLPPLLKPVRVPEVYSVSSTPQAGSWVMFFTMPLT